MEGRVVVVTDAALARAVSGSGAAVVVASADPASARVVTELEAEGRRVAHFSGDLAEEADREALAELLDELFPT